MSKPTRSAPIPDLIAVVGERLTPTERRIAEAVLAEPTLLAFGTVAKLSEHVGTSRPSIVRFANKLGFDGFADLQEYVRTGVSRQLSRPTDRIRHQGATNTSTRTAFEVAIAAVFDAANEDRIVELAKPLARSENVWIITGETSRAGAHVLHSGLMMIRSGVHLVDDQSTGSQLSSASPRDSAVVIDFFRYRRAAIIAARALAEIGVELVAITDGPLSPLAALTETWCDLKVPAIGPFDSSVPAVAMAERLVAQVAWELRNDAREHIDRTEELWSTTETFFPH